MATVTLESRRATVRSGTPYTEEAYHDRHQLVVTPWMRREEWPLHGGPYWTPMHVWQISLVGADL